MHVFIFIYYIFIYILRRGCTAEGERAAWAEFQARNINGKPEACGGTDANMMPCNAM